MSSDGCVAVSKRRTIFRKGPYIVTFRFGTDWCSPKGCEAFLSGRLVRAYLVVKVWDYRMHKKCENYILKFRSSMYNTTVLFYCLAVAWSTSHCRVYLFCSLEMMTTFPDRFWNWVCFSNAHFMWRASGGGAGQYTCYGLRLQYLECCLIGISKQRYSTTITGQLHLFFESATRGQTMKQHDMSLGKRDIGAHSPELVELLRLHRSDLAFSIFSCYWNHFFTACSRCCKLYAGLKNPVAYWKKTVITTAWATNTYSGGVGRSKCLCNKYFGKNAVAGY